MILVGGIAGYLLLDPPLNTIVIVLAAIVEVGETFAWIQFLKRYRIRTGVEAMIGEPARVIEECSPVGQVRIRGESWRARSEVPVGPGEWVRVRAVEGLELTVEPDSDAAPFSGRS